MTIENRELYHELKECYPEFFNETYKYIRPARACGKTLMTVFIMMAIEYTHWFVYKLEMSNVSLTREEYENGLITIEKLLYGTPFPTVYKDSLK
jgi:hypothetical protein